MKKAQLAEPQSGFKALMVLLLNMNIHFSQNDLYNVVCVGMHIQ